MVAHHPREFDPADDEEGGIDRPAIADPGDPAAELVLGPIGEEAVDRVVDGVPNAEKNPDDAGPLFVEAHLIDEEIGEGASLGKRAEKRAEAIG